MGTITGLIAAASLLPVAVSTGAEARPTTPGKVLWIGGATKPTNMANGDIWFRIPTTGPTAPTITTTVLNTITQSVSFTQSLAVNGTGPFAFSLAAGTLPTGLTLNGGTGVISGTPSASGSYSFTIQATNAVGSDTQAYSGTVTSSAVVPTITTTVLDSLTQGTAFSQSLSATGTSPLTWTISAGTVPSGLSLNSATGVIAGTPTGSGAYSFTVQATNTAGNDTQAYSGTIASSGVAPTITTTSLTTLTQGTAFSQTLNKTGSTPMTWGISAGTLPSGLGINSSSGVISGTPTGSGAYSFTVQATNSFGNDTQAFTGSINAGSDADIYSIFGSTVPATLTSYTDAVAGDWLTHTFYCTTGTQLPTGSKIVGCRLYVPAGSAHIGQLWYSALIVSTSGKYPDLGTFPYTQYNSNGTKIAGSALVAGWNEITYAAETNVPASPGSWYQGIQIGDGSRYLFNNSLNPSAIQNPQGKNFYLSEVTSSIVSRHFYNSSTGSATNWYGIDTKLRIPA
jgi:hypothetical protein